MMTDLESYFINLYRYDVEPVQDLAGTVRVYSCPGPHQPQTVARQEEAINIVVCLQIMVSLL